MARATDTLENGRIDWAGNLAVADLVAVLTLLSLETGGLRAPALMWVGAIPLAAICMVGTRSGICWTILMLGETAGFYFAKDAGWLTPGPLTGNQHDFLLASGLGGLQLVVLSLGAMYEAQKEWALGLVLGREQALSEALATAEHSAIALTAANTALQREVIERQQAETALRESEAQCRQAKEIAEASNRIKSEFLANMSHEIRTPMTAILGYLDLIGDHCDDHCPHSPAVLQNHLSTVRRNGEHLLQVISDILDLSKIEAGKMEVESVECSLAAVLAEVESVARVAATRKGLGFTTKLIGPLPTTIRTDPTRLKQILLNLISNAVKFTEAGHVRLEVRLLEGPAFGAAGGTAADGLVQFDVTDTGIGMSEEGIGRLFQPFSQLHGATNRKYGGTGLGLAICRRLAESLGGQISVQSEPGKGSTLSVTVATGPLNEVSMVAPPSSEVGEAAAKPESPALSQLRGRRILLAEDGPDNQRLISMILTRAGAQVTIAENGRIAVEQALSARSAGHPFDVILMDMQMPEMDGYAATAHLRNQGYSGPIIAVTAHAMVTDRDNCLAAGCDDYASKPIDRFGLLGLIAHYLDVARVA